MHHSCACDDSCVNAQGKGVEDEACHLGGARVKSERKYRQYMNRTTGYDDIRTKASGPPQ